MYLEEYLQYWNQFKRMRILELMQQFETDILILHVQHSINISGSDKIENSHIKKIDRESVARKIYYEKVLADLMGKLDVSEENAGIPKRLSLEEQGRFMLGYYHQIQKKYEKKEDK